MPKVCIIPRRVRIAIHSRRFALAVPADPESIAVRGLHVSRRVAALVEQRKAAVAKEAEQPIELGLREVEPAADVEALGITPRRMHQVLDA